MNKTPLQKLKCKKCGYSWEQKPKPTCCIKCGHEYVEWVNYEDFVRTTRPDNGDTTILPRLVQQIRH